MSALPLVTIKELKKQYGKKKLFENLNLVVNDRAKIGVVGPNGAGKSSLLKIIAGLDEPDSGEVKLQKGLQVSYVAQTANFNLHETPLALAIEAAAKGASSEAEKLRLAHQALGELEIDDIEGPCEQRSGGQIKRLQICLLYTSPSPRDRG